MIERALQLERPARDIAERSRGRRARRRALEAQLERRVDELLQHEATRESQIIDAFGGAAATGGEIASRLPWTRRNKSFAELGEFHQQFAVAETLAHLEHLRGTGRASREGDGTTYRYALNA